MIKSFKELLLPLTEAEYRQLPSYSYSMLSSFYRNGPNVLIDPQFIDTTATRNGSLFDALLTEPESIADRFYIASFPQISDTLKVAVTKLVAMFPTIPLKDIPSKDTLAVLDEIDYGKAWKPETRIAKLYEVGIPYATILTEAGNRTIISPEEHARAILAKDVLLERPATREYFLDNPFNTTIEGIYQAKLSATINGIAYRCMFDKLIINHQEKTITPVDLKTTGHSEEAFQSSFLTWMYYLQGTLYPDILQTIIKDDEYFKDFTILNFRFVVIHVPQPNPMVWIMPFKDELYQLLGSNKYPTYEAIAQKVKWHHDNNVYNCAKETYENNYIRNITLDFLQ